jgi:hypothetical protein
LTNRLSSILIPYADNRGPARSIERGRMRPLPPRTVGIAALHAGAGAVVVWPRVIGMLLADPAARRSGSRASSEKCSLRSVCFVDAADVGCAPGLACRGWRRSPSNRFDRTPCYRSLRRVELSSGNRISAAPRSASAEQRDGSQTRNPMRWDR